MDASAWADLAQSISNPLSAHSPPDVVSVVVQPTLRAGFGLSVDADARIVALVSEPGGDPGPAEKAGVGAVLGGRVTAVNGAPVANGASLAAALQGHGGAAVELWIDRQHHWRTRPRAAALPVARARGEEPSEPSREKGRELELESEPESEPDEPEPKSEPKPEPGTNTLRVVLGVSAVSIGLVVAYGLWR
eukprot:COSAG04_NODE_888_length_9606_cov_4.172359_3_plen_191_part_00